MSAIDWRKIRDTLPPIAEDEPALSWIYGQLHWLDTHPIPEGVDPMTERTYSDINNEYRQSLLDAIEYYRWQQAGYNTTKEMLDACRDE